MVEEPAMPPLPDDDEQPAQREIPGSDPLLQIVLGVLLAAAFCGLVMLKILTS